MLQEQRIAYDMLRATCNNLEGECGSTEQELKKLSAKLSKLVRVLGRHSVYVCGCVGVCEWE